MSWLRLDDGAARHPKLAGLTPADKWGWVELLLWCAADGRGGRVPGDVEQLPRSVTLELVGELELRGLLDRDGDGLRVHDWADYNGARTGAERTAAWRDRKYGPARYSHGGRRGAYQDSRTATSSETAVTAGERHGEVTTRALGPHPEDKDSSDVEPLPVGAELAAARLLAACGGVERVGEARADFIRGACARLPESIPAGLVELVERGHARDPAGYVVGALSRELAARGLS